MASDDLGGLGDKNGPPPTLYSWTMPSMMPEFLPFFIVLALLGLKPNRTSKAWFIWIPVAVYYGITIALQNGEKILPVGSMEFFSQILNSVLFGFAATWLLSPYLVRKFRILTFLSFVFALELVSVLTYAIRVFGEWSFTDAPFLVSLLLMSFGLSIALALAALVCRKRYRPVWFSVSVLLWLLLGLTALASPFVFFASMGNGMSLAEMAGDVFKGVLSATGGMFVLVLPYLILSFTNSFYRERFKTLFHLDATVAPPVIPPPVPTTTGPEGV